MMTDLKEINAEFFKPYMTVLNYYRWTGIDIFDEKNAILYKFKYMRVIIFLLYIITSFSHWWFVIREVNSGTDLLDLAVDLSFSYNSIEGCLMFLYINMIKRRIKNFVMKLEKLWRDDASLPVSIVMLKRDQGKQIDLYNYAYCKLLEVFIIVYLGTPLIIIFVKKFILKYEVQLTPPLQFLYPFEYKDNIVVFVIEYIFDSLTVCSMAYSVNCCLFLLSVTMSQLRTLFVLLQEDFKEIIQSKNTETESKLKETIQRHVTLSAMLAQLGNAYGGTFAIHVFFVSINICFYGIAARIKRRLEDFKNFSISIVATVIIYHCCRHGQLATDSALDIATAIYESGWEDLSCQNKKYILLTILRSQRATYIHSTSFTEISLNTFKMIMNTTWSFISLITNIYAD